MSGMMTQEEATNMSNEQAVQLLTSMKDMMYDQYGCPISDAVFALDKAIGALSVDRPQGKWIIEIDANGNTYGRCSICDMKQYAGQLNFCPDCGADMRGVDDAMDAM